MCKYPSGQWVQRVKRTAKNAKSCSLSRCFCVGRSFSDRIDSECGDEHVAQCGAEDHPDEDVVEGVCIPLMMLFVDVESVFHHQHETDQDLEESDAELEARSESERERQRERETSEGSHGMILRFGKQEIVRDRLVRFCVWELDHSELEFAWKTPWSRNYGSRHSPRMLSASTDRNII